MLCSIFFILMVYGFGIDPEMKLVCDLKSKLIINELNEPIKIETKESTVKVFINTQERKFIYRNKRCPNEYLTINKEYSLCNNREEEISKLITDDVYDVFPVEIPGFAQEVRALDRPGLRAYVGAEAKVDRTDIQVDEGADNKLSVVESGVTLQDLINGLNSLGIGPRDLITILQAVKAAGALQAEIQVM